MHIKGLDQLQKKLNDAQKAFQSLDGVIAELSFDPHDAVSVENAISEMELAINKKISHYRGNELVDQTAKEMKAQYRDEILKKAEMARLESGENNMVNGGEYQNIFQRINNIVADLQRAQYNTFDAAIKKLSITLNNEILADLNANLTKGVNLQDWLGECKKTRGGMVGSAKLLWSENEAEELGTKILLIHHFAQNSGEAENFSHVFYYAGNSITSGLQNMTSQMILPFARDYIQYVKNHISYKESVMTHGTAGDTYNIHVNGGTQQQFNIGHSTGHQYNEAIKNDLHAIQELIIAIRASALEDAKKDDLITSLEIIVEQAKSDKPNPSWFKTAYRQIEQKVREKACNIIGESIVSNGTKAIQSLASTMGISLGL